MFALPVKTRLEMIKGGTNLRIEHSKRLFN